VALEAVFERFTKKSPLTVMARLLMQQAPSREWLDEQFEQHRDKQYTSTRANCSSPAWWT
jgi:hypothetical protein